MMKDFHHTLTSIARYLYCSTVPEEWSFRDLPIAEKWIHVVKFGFDMLDFVNMILDVMFLITLYGINQFQAVILMFGIFLARLTARRGNDLGFRGGLPWVPFCQSPLELLHHNAERARSLFLLYNVLFTEISVFLYEDVTLIMVYLFNDMSDGPVTVGSFDKVNIWMTVLSTIATMLLWLATMVCSSWNPLFWFHEKRDEFRQQVRLIDKVWVGSRIGMGFLLGFVRGILFLALFGVILVYISFVLQAALLLTTVEHVPDDVRKRVQLVSLGPTGIFVIAVASAWTVAAFFSCKIRRQQREPPLLVEPTQQDDDDVVAVAVATPVPSYPLTDAPCNTVTPTMMVHGQQDDDDDMQQPQQHLGDTQQPRPPVPANVMQPSFPSQDIEEPTMLSPSRRSFAIQDTEEPSTTLRISSVGEEAGRLTNHSMTPVDHSAKEEPTLHSAAPRCPVDAEEPTMIQQTSTRSLPARMDPTTAQILSTRSMPSLVLRTILRPVTTARDFARSLHSEDNDGEDAEFA